jgi:hypothetical protein
MIHTSSIAKPGINSTALSTKRINSTNNSSPCKHDVSSLRLTSSKKFKEQLPILPLPSTKNHNILLPSQKKPMVRNPQQPPTSIPPVHYCPLFYSFRFSLVLIVAIAIAIPPKHEWEAFTAREQSLLKPDHKPRDPLKTSFPFSTHPLTQPLLETRLTRKSTLLKRKQPAFYVLTRSGYIHEYKDNDPVLYPDPTLSLKLSDCSLGPRGDGSGFTLKGKDAGKSFGGRTHEYVFLTDNQSTANEWWDGIATFTSNAVVASPVAADDSEPTSPVTSLKTRETPQQSPVGAMQNAPEWSGREANPGGTATQPVQTETPMHTAPTSPVGSAHANVTGSTGAPTGNAGGYVQSAATTASQGRLHPATTKGTL